MQTELNDARLIARDQAVDAPERRIASRLIGQREVRVIQEVQHLGAELQGVAFTDAEVFP